MPMSVSAPNPMRRLFDRLRKLGLTRTYLREKALPDWWDDRIAENPAGFAEGSMFISRHIGLDLATLLDPNRPIEDAYRHFGSCKFKSPMGADVREFALTRAIATRIAQFVNTAVSEPYSPHSRTAAEIRHAIIAQGAGCIGLSSLLDYCWASGIPVIHLWGLPSEAKKPDGLAIRIKDRPVIVICKRDKFPAWLLFILAHELGHIALGHVSEGQVLVDQSLKDNEADPEERGANEFAIELLTGDPNRRFSGTWRSVADLVALAKHYGDEYRVDPGHVILNMAYSKGGEFWALANAVLGHLEPARDGLEQIRSRMLNRLDWDRLSEDSSNYLSRLTRTEENQ